MTRQVAEVSGQMTKFRRRGLRVESGMSGRAD